MPRQYPRRPRPLLPSASLARRSSSDQSTSVATRNPTTAVVGTLARRAESSLHEGSSIHITALIVDLPVQQTLTRPLIIATCWFDMSSSIVLAAGQRPPGPNDPGPARRAHAPGNDAAEANHASDVRSGLSGASTDNGSRFHRRSSMPRSTEPQMGMMTLSLNHGSAWREI